MEFRNIQKQEYESYQKYLDLLFDVHGSIDKLAVTDFEGCRYFVSDGEDAVGIVVDDGESPKPFFINLDDPNFQVYGDLDFIYNIVDSEMKEVIKSNPLGSYETRVSYLPAIENYPRDVLEYSQYLGEINSLLEMKYDVTERKTVESSITYSYYQLPDDIHLQYLKQYGSIALRRNNYYGRSLDEDDLFYSPILVVRGYPIGQKNKTFDGKKLMDQFQELGFNKQIPSELASLVTGNNKEYKTLKLINNEYKKHIKGQN